MNIVSNLFNPTVCAGYILILYLFTARKLEVIAFLVWFLFFSWMIIILKQIYQQPRPFWVSSQVQMLEWTCYAEYGNPSGHSSLVIVLLDFFVRFSCRWHPTLRKFQWVMYLGVIAGEATVMLSRFYLGMHSLNQIMFGLMIGAYSITIYYLYIEKWMFSVCIGLLEQGKKKRNLLLLLGLTVFMAAQQILQAYLPTYNPPNDPINPWISTIAARPGCSSFRYETSFFMRCFQDQSIAFGIPAFLLSLSITHNGFTLLKKLSYPKCSLKFLMYMVTTLVIAAVPLAIFLNPLWKKINTPNVQLLLWVIHGLGISLGIICLVGVSPHLLKCFQLDTYDFQSYYNDFKVTVSMIKSDKNQMQMVGIELPRPTSEEGIRGADEAPDPTQF